MIPTEVFMQWGAAHHFPQLVLSTDPPDVLRAGQAAWTRFFVEERDPLRLKRAEARIRLWDARLACSPVQDAAHTSPREEATNTFTEQCPDE